MKQNELRFRNWADALETRIEHLGRPMTQNPTPKRNREYQARLCECRNVERLQKALRVLADLHEQGTCPVELSHFAQKVDIAGMVSKGWSSAHGYYSCVEDDDYRDKSPAAQILQRLIEGSQAERAETQRERQVGQLAAEVALSDIPGYFPTPRAVVERMLVEARIQVGMQVLEPSAGSGHIADVIRETVPEVRVDCIEINPRLRKILELKGHLMLGCDDFRNLPPVAIYDRVVMNPPFEEQQDIYHVRQAYGFLKPGGILVSIIGPGFQYRADRDTVKFREWLKGIEERATGPGGGDMYIESLPEGSFEHSGTGVSAKMLVLVKEGVEP